MNKLNNLFVSCKKTLRLFLRRIYVSKKTNRERDLSRLEFEMKLERKSRHSCFINFAVISIPIACYFLLLPVTEKYHDLSKKTMMYLETEVDSQVNIQPEKTKSSVDGSGKEVVKNIITSTTGRQKRKLFTSTPSIFSMNSNWSALGAGGRALKFRHWKPEAANTTGNRRMKQQLPVQPLKQNGRRRQRIVMHIDNKTLTATSTAKQMTGTTDPSSAICLMETDPFDTNVKIFRSMFQISLKNLYPMVQNGGYFKPDYCIPNHKVAVLVPYRDRTLNLNSFLYHIHPFLMEQSLEYQIFVIEQFGNNMFNRGRLFNAGFSEIMKLGNWTCIILHDVDLLPVDRRNFYICPSFPRSMCNHIVNAADSMENDDSYGCGAIAISPTHYYKINGFSNRYIGRDREDEDMFWRTRMANIPITKYEKKDKIARYFRLPHDLAPEESFRSPKDPVVKAQWISVRSKSRDG